MFRVKRLCMALGSGAVTLLFADLLVRAYTLGVIAVPGRRGGGAEVAMASGPAKFWACVVLIAVFAVCAIAGTILFALETVRGEEL